MVCTFLYHLVQKNHIYNGFRFLNFLKTMRKMNEYPLNAEDIKKYDDSVDNLQSYLTVQKQIFETAA